MSGRHPMEGGRGHGPTQSTKSRAAALDPESLSVHVRHSARHRLTPTPSFKFKTPDLTLQTSAQWRGLFKTPSVFGAALSSFPRETPVAQRPILSKGCVSTNLLDLPGEGGSGGSLAVLRSWAAAPLLVPGGHPTPFIVLFCSLNCILPKSPAE